MARQMLIREALEHVRTHQNCPGIPSEPSNCAPRAMAHALAYYMGDSEPERDHYELAVEHLEAVCDYDRKKGVTPTWASRDFLYEQNFVHVPCVGNTVYHSEMPTVGRYIRDHLDFVKHSTAVIYINRHVFAMVGPEIHDWVGREQTNYQYGWRWDYRYDVERYTEPHETVSRKAMKSKVFRIMVPQDQVAWHDEDCPHMGGYPSKWD